MLVGIGIWDLGFGGGVEEFLYHGEEHLADVADYFINIFRNLDIAKSLCKFKLGLYFLLLKRNLWL